MPKLKQSVGRFKIVTPFPEEFCRWLNYELHNSKTWNPHLIACTGQSTYVCTTKDSKHLWTIRLDTSGGRKGAEFISDLPKIWIRKGLEVSMGQQRILIEGNTP